MILLQQEMLDFIPLTRWIQRIWNVESCRLLCGQVLQDCVYCSRWAVLQNCNREC